MKTRAEWIAEAAAKVPGGTYPGLVPMAKVEHVMGSADRQLHGQFSWMSLDKALAGEKRGLWTIVEAFGADREGV